ncbi:hypothetical protein TNCV_1445171 [Trichonephila clavipes]|nr:hypothetical protein TNCV_1445171 [Trichonephila clavipes]
MEESVCSVQDILKYYIQDFLHQQGNYRNRVRKGRPTIQHIFNISRILEKTREFGIDTHPIFIDFKTAYDSIIRKDLIAAIKEFKILYIKNNKLDIKRNKERGQGAE